MGLDPRKVDILGLPPCDIDVEVKSRDVGIDPADVVAGLILQYVKMCRPRRVDELEELLWDVYEYLTKLGYEFEECEDYSNVIVDIPHMTVTVVDHCFSPRGSIYSVRVKYALCNRRICSPIEVRKVYKT